MSLALADSRWWGILGVFALEPHFQDMAAILAAVEAVGNGLNPYVPNPFDLLGRPHSYGPWWLWLDVLGLTTDDNWWLGSLLVLVSLVTATSILAPKDRRTAFITVLLLMGTPLMLAFERANNDLIIFLMFVGVAALLDRPGRSNVVWSAFILLVAAALKFYPLAAYPVLLLSRDRPFGFKVLIGLLLASCFVLVIWLQEFIWAYQEVARPRSTDAVGVEAFGNMWNFPVGNRWALSIGWLVGGLSTTLVAWKAWPRPCSGKPERGWLPLPFALGGMVWCSCYLAGSNYLYRWVLLFLPAAIWIKELQDPVWGKLARAQLHLMIVFGVGWIAWKALISDATLVDPVIGSAFWLVVGTLHGLALVLTVFIGIRLIVGVGHELGVTAGILSRRVWDSK